MKTVLRYIESYTENLREWLAWKIFPEFGFYMEAVKRVGEIEENDRCLKALDDADSACSEWAKEAIRIKYHSLEDIMEKFKEQGFDEQPF